ncbi:MAG: hypothetical protein EOP45_00920 [Sphingobacteriaceae bacterium]|nr:MAG: hypothetical protein EOP45_00920 [Sphingobacteriaceae bacterium]
MNQKLIFRASLFCLLITLTACSSTLKRSVNYTGKWSGSDLPGHNYATFEDFNGHQNFSITPTSKGTLYIKYVATVAKGTLNLKISSPKKTIVSKTISGTIADSVLVANSNQERLSILFDASHADGSFDLKYGSKKE